jgi:1-aminocyclopropane-1-carboxylate deaminase
MLNLKIPSPVTKLNSQFLKNKNIDLFMKRDDLIHEFISGNKWRKLKYNLLEAKKQGYTKVLSFGGPYSNHLHALSYTCNMLDLKSVGIIRGENSKIKNHTQSFCIRNNMELYYIDRLNYNRYKNNNQLPVDIECSVGKCFIIPEGGCNDLGLKGCEEIIPELDVLFNYICAPVGTGCTAAGLIKQLNNNQIFLGFCAFSKSYEQENSIKYLLKDIDFDNWNLFADNYFGGFAKVNSILFKFIDQFKLEYGVELDLIYTGKMLYSLFQLIEKDFFPKNTILLIIHTGGIQGVKSFNRLI